MPQLHPEKWVDNYLDYLYSLALLRVGNPADAEDIVQEAMLSAYKAKDGFKGESSEKTWLVAILNNKIKDFFRTKYKLQPLSGYLEETEAAFHDSFFDEKNDGRFKALIRPCYFSKSGEDYLLGEEFARILEACILKLPTKLRQVFVAKYMSDTASDAICKEYEITASNFWVIVHRSKLLLRACLEKQGVG
ncbi:MAG: sigma-70 family RNA polymerase sigma factor [Saprospiraceae bacterium]|nr:sigma-70 family RNA polymerase sigma factor [Saprospiraceae bacterium]